METTQVFFSPKRYRQLAVLLALLILLMGAGTYAAAPAGRVILDLNVALPGQEAVTVSFDRAALEALPQTTVVTATPWTDGEVSFQGPLLQTLIEHVGADANHIEAVALNDYSVDIPVADALEYPVIIAMTMDGKLMSVREKGPLWVIYPWSDEPSLQSEPYYARSIWQLRRLILR